MGAAEIVNAMALASSLTAAIALASNRLWRLSRALSLFVLVSALGQALILAWPGRFWTAEFCFSWDACMAVLTAVLALELGRLALRPAAHVWQRACRRIALLLVPLALVGVFGLLSVGGQARVGYRGLVVVDAAVAGLLALVLTSVSLSDLPRHPLISTALVGLLRHFALRAAYLGAWEIGPGLAGVIGWATTASYVWAMLALARTASISGGKPILKLARVSE